MVDEFYCVLRFSPPSQWAEQIRVQSEFKFKFSSEANVHILAGYVLHWAFDKMLDHGSS